MRIIISSLLLIGGLNLILARSLYWNDHDSMGNMWLNNYNYDDELFKYPSNGYNDDNHKLIMGESSEESKETPFYTTIDNEEDVNLANFFSSMFDPFLEIDSTNKEKSKKETSNNEEISNNENDNKDDKNDDEENNQFEIFLHVPSDNMETDLQVSKSSEEKKNDEEENSDEVSTPASNVVVEFIDLTKSSEEKEDVDEQVDVSKKDIEELAALIITLTAIDDLMKIAHENLDYADNGQDDKLKCKEVDEYLNLFISLLDKVLEDEQNTTENEENNDDVTMVTNDSDEEDIDYTTPKNDSNEDDDTDDDKDNGYTTPKTDSNEDDDTDDDFTTPKNDSNEDDDTDDDFTTHKNDSNEDDDINTSNSNEIEDISIVFHGIDDDHHESNINDHKYEIVETSANDFPYMNAIRSSSSPGSDNEIVIQEYVGIREDFDIEQDALQMNKLNLDKDFYNIISDDFNEDSVTKFEKDFLVVNENLDRIKRIMNAMQDLNSKLYFYKLIKDTLKDVQHK